MLCRFFPIVALFSAGDCFNAESSFCFAFFFFTVIFEASTGETSSIRSIFDTDFFIFTDIELSKPASPILGIRNTWPVTTCLDPDGKLTCTAPSRTATSVPPLVAIRSKVVPRTPKVAFAVFTVKFKLGAAPETKRITPFTICSAPVAVFLFISKIMLSRVKSDNSPTYKTEASRNRMSTPLSRLVRILWL
jgi:hypothetical protein